jgi:transcriptional regulator with XRE-family HTH domain
MFSFTIESMSAESFAERLEEAMRERGITAAALATAIGVSRASISLLLSKDSKSMRPEHLFAAADFLGVEPRWLAIGEGPKVAPAAALPAELLEILKKHIQP